VTTDPGSTFLPNLPPLVTNGPRPTMEGLAGEMGKLEKKLEILLAGGDPPSLLDRINRIIDQIENVKFVLDNLFPPEPYTFSAGSFQLQPVCEKDAEGNPAPPKLASWTGGEGEVVEVRKKIEALAELIQHHKDTKQPICRPTTNNSNVTVHFESD
jgi:hypothetical protein